MPDVMEAALSFVHKYLPPKRYERISGFRHRRRPEFHVSQFYCSYLGADQYAEWTRTQEGKVIVLWIFL